MAKLLDDLSGFEFEDLMEDVFRNMGYLNVRQAERTADEGRDVLMEEEINGQRRGVVVECKHTDTVGRPVVQKLHSAVSTYDYDGPKRGIVATTGTFTGPAREYAQRLQASGRDGSVELLDGTELREIGEEIGLDLYNGRIEIICEETLRPTHPTASPDEPLKAAFADVDNISPSHVNDPFREVVFEPALSVIADIDATFETSVGVIHSIDTTDRLTLLGKRGGPERPDADVHGLLENNRAQAVEMDTDAFGETFDTVAVERFGWTETEYKEWTVDHLRDRHTTTVHYTGDNNVDYDKTCEPRQSDISVQSIDPLYLPRVSYEAHLGEYTYPYECYVAGPSHVTENDGVRRCVHCENQGTAHDYTFCENCGAIACGDHIREERLEGEPVCTGCAVTERFALKTKYFYDEANREAFREEYDSMPVHHKAMENPSLVAGIIGVVLLAGVVVVGAL